ncbi:hypothetical protein QAD02_014946 [Eretmocerus hayati]|uniref:Uncharacterized protein n=1 Tax=Eretmocerus hayati TaxID=131215 RepID=A0ACC2P972_9HYME|nr:hypothetical protein QAD02_014946 [Eretmocerus hayati]
MSAEGFGLIMRNVGQPVCFPTGEGFSLGCPDNYLPEHYKPFANQIANRFGDSSERVTTVKQIAIPDLSIPLQLPRRETFSVFIPAQQKMAAYLIMLFIGMRTPEDLLSLAAYCRNRLNPQMLIYALSVAMLHRQDTRDIDLPHFNEIFPDKFMDSRIFSQAREQFSVLPNGVQIPLEIPLDFTGSDAEAEHRVAYWREDIGVNLHHWHWHLVYPFEGPQVVVNKDRRGELFYYMHHQLLSRFNTERLCNNLARSKPLDNLRETIPEGYFPKLDQIIAGRAWPSRPSNMKLSNVNRTADGFAVTLSQMESWRDALIKAMISRRMRDPKGSEVYLDDTRGIDILGNAMEASIISINRDFYGSYHNLGHIMISTVHDPDHRHLESVSVMGDSTTAMRDPIFYRWHQHIDDLFSIFKDRINPYSQQELNYPGISVTDVRVNSPNASPNTFNTYWTKSDIDLSRGLDFSARGPILARVQHLNHDEFKYTIVVNNANNKEMVGTVRIFLAPKFNEQGRPLPINEQRKMMIEMDKFFARLKRGSNVLERSSTESSVTIPYEATFRNVDKGRPSSDNTSASLAFNFCGCGWPHHMLLPRGTPQGYPMELFVMVSDFELDRVDQKDPSGCSESISFCGLRDRKYPDARAMGFPFDRTARAGVKSLSEFLTPNMKVQQVNIRFSNVIKPRQQQRPNRSSPR